MPRRRSDVDWGAVSAAAPLGVIHRRDLAVLGVADSTIARRTAPGGPWVHVILGVIAVFTGAPTRAQRIAAALLYAGPDAILMGASACRIHGLTKIPDDDQVQVLIPHARRRSSRSFVVVERTRRMPEPRIRDDVPVAPIARAVVDAARALRSLDAVRALVAEAVQEGLTRPAALRDEVDRGTRRGTALLRIALEEIEDGIRSAAEAWGREVATELRGEGFPEIRWNVRLYAANGAYIASPDGWVEEVGMAWEIQSHQYHLSPEHHEKSMRHVARLLAHHIVVAEPLPKDLKRRRTQVKADLWARYHLARSRPRPPVVAR